MCQPIIEKVTLAKPITTFKAFQKNNSRIYGLVYDAKGKIVHIPRYTYYEIGQEYRTELRATVSTNKTLGGFHAFETLEGVQSFLWQEGYLPAPHGLSLRDDMSIAVHRVSLSGKAFRYSYLFYLDRIETRKRVSFDGYAAEHMVIHERIKNVR